MCAQEPPKKQLVAYDSGTGPCPPRKAFCILQAWPKADVVEVVVDLSRGRGQVTSWKEVSAQLHRAAHTTHRHACTSCAAAQCASHPACLLPSAFKGPLHECKPLPGCIARCLAALQPTTMQPNL